MMNEKANLILHPVRMQIVQTLIGGRRLTVQEMGQRLSAVPQATLYRHLNKLVQGGVIEAVEQHQVRGAVEKVYALSSGGVISPQEFMESSNEEKMEVFIQFVSGLINNFGSYVNQEKADFVKDGATFRQAELHMNDDEFQEFTQGIAAVFQKFIQNDPRDDRKKRTIATIIIPDAGKGVDES
ncbi:helix-turn-helix domain-containing protein [Ectobacillus funiculus]|uniref:helix-turn-helix domain-containing protein n=1 Tax=Ectobacillus funiculus TaxID=137993 RepID=UPI00397D7B0D